MNHLIHPYNYKIRAYDTIFLKDRIEVDGTFFKPTYAVKAIVDYKTNYGNANNGYYPFNWDKTPDLIITDHKGKKITYKTPFFATTISLM